MKGTREIAVRPDTYGRKFGVDPNRDCSDPKKVVYAAEGAGLEAKNFVKNPLTC